MNYLQILEEINNKNFKPLYFLHGLEPYFIDQITKKIEENALEEHEKDFNQTILYGMEVDVANLLSIIKQYPMGANRQLVIIKEAQDIGKLDLLQSYFENPVDSTILVLAYKHKKLDKRKKTFKTLEKNGIVLESKPLYDNQVPTFIDNYVKDKGLTINKKSIQLIHEFLGNDLSKICNEIDKMLINLSDSNKITEIDIENNIGISKDYNLFELQRALGQKDVLKANKIISYFGANKKEFPLIKVVINLFYYFQKLLKYHFTENKSNKNVVASTIGVAPFFVDEYILAAKNYHPKKLTEIISLLKDFDLKAKGYENESASDKVLLQELIYKILH